MNSNKQYYYKKLILINHLSKFNQLLGSHDSHNKKINISIQRMFKQGKKANLSQIIKISERVVSFYSGYLNKYKKFYNYRKRTLNCGS